MAAAWIWRPVTARLLEPSAWLVAWAVLGARLPDSTIDDIAPVFLSYLVLRLVADTAPNLRVCARLEDAPYDERPIRHALVRAKLLLALALVLGAWFALRFLDESSVLFRAARSAGGAPAFAGWMFLVLASFAFATPVLRDHRGVPIARPSLGPGAGALLVLAAAPWLPARPGPLLAAVALAIVAGNVVVGGAQRYLSAARRLKNPAFVLGVGDPQARGRRRDEEERLVREALSAAPFVLLPVWPVLVAVSLGRAEVTHAAGAAFLTGLPPTLFDAKLPSRRFALTSVLCAGCAALLFAATQEELFLEAAALAATWPLANRLLHAGRARLLAICIVILVLGSAVFASVPWPAAWILDELLFAACLACAAFVRNPR